MTSGVTRTRAIKKVPQWEVATRARVRSGLRKYARTIAALAARSANEGDTRILVTEFLCDALGYDRFKDLTMEYLINGEFADYAIKMDEKVVALVEVKRFATKLSTNHLRQVQKYAIGEKIEWMFLTNGRQWQAYHLELSPGMPVETHLVIDVDLLGDGTSVTRVSDLFFLTKESVSRGLIEERLRSARGTSPKALAQVLLSPKVVRAVRTEVWRRTRHRASLSDIEQILKSDVIRADCIL